VNHEKKTNKSRHVELLTAIGSREYNGYLDQKLDIEFFLLAVLIRFVSNW
jgi:hypothetical protein